MMARPASDFSGSLPWQIAVAGMAIMLVASAAIAMSGGAPQRFPAELRTLEAYLDYQRPEPTSDCRRPGEFGDPEAACLRDLNGRPRALLVGDSHMNMFAAAFEARFPEMHFSRISVTGCRPVLEPVGHRRTPKCEGRVHRAFEEVAPQELFDAIVLSARWGVGQSDQVGETVTYLAQHFPTVIVIGQNLEYRRPLPELLMNTEIPRRDTATPDTHSYLAEVRRLNARIRRQVEAAGGAFFDPLDAICEGDRCVALTPDGAPVVYDTNHFSFQGAYLALDSFAESGLFSELLEGPPGGRSPANERSRSTLHVRNRP